MILLGLNFQASEQSRQVKERRKEHSTATLIKQAQAKLPIPSPPPSFLLSLNSARPKRRGIYSTRMRHDVTGNSSSDDDDGDDD